MLEDHTTSTDCNSSDSSDDNYVYSLSQRNYAISHTSILILNTPLDFFIDTGAGFNILDKLAYDSLPKSPDTETVSY